MYGVSKIGRIIYNEKAELVSKETRKFKLSLDLPSSFSNLYGRETIEHWMYIVLLLLTRNPYNYKVEESE